MEDMQQDQAAGAPVEQLEQTNVTADTQENTAVESTEEASDLAIDGETGAADALPADHSEGERDVQEDPPSGAASDEAAEELPKEVGINVNTDMPQENDPVESGEMKEVIDTMVDPVPEVSGVLGGVVDAAAAAAVDSAVSNVGEEAAALSEEEAYIAKLKATGTEAQQRMIAAIETFEQRLRPKAAISPEDCNKAQYELLRHLVWLLKKDYDTFRGGWNALLVYFSLNHGLPSPTDYSALSEYSTFRYLSSWTKTQEECNLYVNLVTLLRSTRNKATRKHNIKMISIDKVGVGYLGEKEISNLKLFYEA